MNNVETGLQRVLSCIRTVVFFGLWVMVSVVGASALTSPQLTYLSSSRVNTPANYSVAFKLGTVALVSGDMISILFPANTRIALLPALAVQVNGMVCTSTPLVSGQRVDIEVPSDLSSNADVTVDFTGNVLTNPSVPGTTYQFQVQTSEEPVWINSSMYSITPASTSVAVGTITASTFMSNAVSNYRIPVTLGTAGSLWGGHSQVVVTFPTGTIVPNGSLSGVTVDGLPVASALGNAGACQVTLVPGQDLFAPATVTVRIPSITNPGAGMYSLQVHTDAEPNNGVSPGYSVGTGLSMVRMDAMSDSYANRPVNYTLYFRLGVDGLDPADTISVQLPPNTKIGTLTTTSIYVNGTSLSQPPVVTGQRIDLRPPNAIGASSNVYLQFNGNVLTNPSVPGPAYQFQLQTNREPVWMDSLSYTISPEGNRVNVGSITASTFVRSMLSTYDIPVTLGVYGSLWGGHNQVVVTFPNNTLVPNGSLSGVTVDGMPVVSATGNASLRQVTLVPQQDLVYPMTFIVRIPGVTNPSTSNNYLLYVNTDAQPGTDSSPSYTIGEPLSNIQMNTLSSNVVNAPSNYTLYFQLGANGLGTSDMISLQFPPNTLIGALTTSSVRVNSNYVTIAPVVTGTRVDFYPPFAIGINTGVTIQFLGTPLTNPSVPGTTYQFQVQTSKEPSWRNSTNYSLVADTGTVTVGTLTLSSLLRSATSSYTIPVTPGTYGRLWGGHNRVTISFPPDTIITNGSLSGITVNGVAAASATGNAAARQITLMPTQDLNPPTMFTVYLPATAVTNPSLLNNYQLYVNTDAQPTNALSPVYRIGNALSSIQMSGMSQNVVNAPTNYNVVFQLGVYNLGTGDTISLQFPPNTKIGALTTASVSVNSTLLTQAPVVSGQQVTFRPPSAINAYSSVNIQFLGNLINNPSVPGTTHQFQLQTSREPVWTNSSAYTIFMSFSTVSVTSLLLSHPHTGLPCAYDFQVTLGPEGSLWGGRSQVIVTFPNDTVVTQGSLSEVRVDGIAVTSAMGNAAARQITLVPAQDLNQPVTFTVHIPSTAVTSPSRAETYQLSVHTDAQPNVAWSPAYVLSHSMLPTVTPTVTCTETPSLPQVEQGKLIVYPQPATGSSIWFYFQMPAPGEITLDLYNVTGEWIQTLYAKSTNSGIQRLSWDISTVAPGIYLAVTRLNMTEQYIKIKPTKVAIIKSNQGSQP